MDDNDVGSLYEQLQAENAALRASKARLLTALEIIACRKQCINNLMSDKEIANAASAAEKEGKC